jgi:hypothetical protein
MSDWRTSRVDGFRRRPLVREQKRAPRLRTEGPSPKREKRACRPRRQHLKSVRSICGSGLLRGLQGKYRVDHLIAVLVYPGERWPIS